MIKLKRNMGGLDPKYWTRWRYFKEITLWEWGNTLKFLGMCVLTLLALVLAFVIVAPRAIWESLCQRTTQ